MFLRSTLLTLSALTLSGTLAFAHPLPSDASASNIMKPFPAPKANMKQFVIELPPQDDEYAFKVGLTAGRYQQTDGVNKVGLIGKLEKKTIQGWGYSYYELEGSSPSAISTLMAPRPGRQPVTKFVSMPEMLVRYNSRMPIVIYVPADMEVKYRIFSAGDEFSATEYQAQDTGDVAPANSLSITSSNEVVFPPGTMATIRLYDSMLMDTDSTYAVHTIAIEKLPTTLPLPEAQTVGRIVGPAVGVSIRDSNGRLLYINDTTTPIEIDQDASIEVKSIR